MKNNKRKDCLRRKHFIDSEKKILVSKILQRNAFCLRKSCPSVILSFDSLFDNGHFVSKAKIHNFCFLTGRSRGISSFFHLSRIKVRNFAITGILPGVRKSSW